MKENCTKLFPIICNSCVNNHVKNENDGAYVNKDIQEKRGGSVRLSDTVGKEKQEEKIARMEIMHKELMSFLDRSISSS
jgi:hypothetical protein